MILKAFLGHFKVLHINSIIFACPINGCSRHFSTIQSLKKHLISIHSHVENINNCVSQSITAITIKNEDNSATVLDSEKVSLDYSQIKPNFCSAIKTEFNLISVLNISTIEKNALDLIGRFLLINKIPLKYIFSFIKENFKMTMFNSECILNELLNSLTQIAEIADKDLIINTFKEITHRYNNTDLRNFTTEFRFTKYLQSCNLYTPPVQVIVKITQKL